MEQEPVNTAPRPKKPRFIAAWCIRHAIHPAAVILAGLLVGTLLVSTLWLLLVMFAGPHNVVESRTVRFGFEDIGELATQGGYFTNVQVVESDRELFGIAVPFTHNKYIYSYDGVIKAGINFSQVKVVVDEEEKQIHVYLPEVRILSCEIDVNSLKVYDESKNVFNQLKLTDVNDALAKLKEEVRATAIANGMIDNARGNAVVIIKGFIGEFYDVKDYEIVIE